MAQTVVNQGASGPGVIFKKAISFAFGTIAANSTKEVTGVFSDDEMVADLYDGVMWSPQAALTGGLANGGGRCNTTGQVAVTIGNLTTGTLTPNTVTLDVYVTKGGADA